MTAFRKRAREAGLRPVHVWVPESGQRELRQFAGYLRWLASDGPPLDDAELPEPVKPLAGRMASTSRPELAGGRFHALGPDPAGLEAGATPRLAGDRERRGRHAG